MSDKRYTVYKHTSPDGKVYIGATKQTMKERCRNHGQGYRYNKLFYDDIISKGWDNFDHEIIATDLNEEDAYKMEQELIHKYNSSHISNGYNKAYGGKGTLGVQFFGENNPFYGKHHSDETRRKLSESKTGEKHPIYGKHRSEETREKIRLANTGHRHSEYTKQKISEKYTRKRRVLCEETGIIYESIADASRDIKALSSNIQAACSGRIHTSGGYHWKYVD